MTFAVLANFAAPLSDLKRNPMRVIKEGNGDAVLILHHNKPAFYAVPPAMYEAIIKLMDTTPN
jgi:antitoxin StbD